MIEIIIDYLCTIFESVCNSQSCKAFELAAAYLEVKEGMKERIVIKNKTNSIGREWKWDGDIKLSLHTCNSPIH